MRMRIGLIVAVLPVVRLLKLSLLMVIPDVTFFLVMMVVPSSAMNSTSYLTVITGRNLASGMV